MPLFRQLELDFHTEGIVVSIERAVPVSGQPLPRLGRQTASAAPGLQAIRARDPELEQQAGKLLRANGAARVASHIRVEWNPRLKSCAGRADFRRKLISLNPRLHAHGRDEVDRTFRHELAHLLAQFRAGRKRIAPHGEEWRQACRDLGIGDEKRCHNLLFPIAKHFSRFLYRCPNCKHEFARTRRIRRAVACLACCRAYSRGRFDARFRLRLIAR